VSATQIAHDAIVAMFLLCGLWALCSLAREEITKAYRGHNLRRKWRDRSNP
jgi:hypothetical protein